MHTSALSNMLAESFCRLEGEELTEQRCRISFLVGAAVRLSDDLIDKKGVRPSEVNLLSPLITKDTISDPDRRLFLAFDQGLKNILPADFKLRFKDSLYNYNAVQENILSLKSNNSLSELIDLKCRTGGHTLLLLYAMLFPEKGDGSRDFVINYDPKGRLISQSKVGAIFNCGIFEAKLDDLGDIDRDKKEGYKSLATEGLITRNTVHNQIDYLETSLNKFYPKGPVTEIVKDYKARTSRFAVMLTDLLRYTSDTGKPST